ncbi:hypothetical protein CCB80_02725 [Armatimonadetes bacterium Uphvl-Ar1]|nr:hypothetical protein CCB80_02725 [Armatimonadetes bacterium Uphvl-Ar1]
MHGSEVMDVRTAIKKQHHAALTMLRECVEVCPDDIWVSGSHPRTFWRIAYHAAAYVHLYLFENLEAFEPWSKHRLDCTYLEGDAEVAEAYNRSEMIECLDLIESEFDRRIDGLDLDAEHCGFTWYPTVSRVELMVLSLRHLHGHIGQLSEILIANGIDTEWKGTV